MDEKTKFDNVVVQYKRTMAYLREILNHTFLRAIYHTSSRQAKLEYEEVQKTSLMIIAMMIQMMNPQSSQHST
jgi:hypothetical protein